MPVFEINYLAVLVAAIINMVVGATWYSPSVFGKKWAKDIGWDEAKMKQMQKSTNNGKSYAINFVAALLMGYVLAHVVDAWQATTVSQGLQAGFLAWLGFIAPAMIGSVLWESRPWRYYFISIGYYLVVLLANGVLLTLWV